MQTLGSSHYQGARVKGGIEEGTGRNWGRGGENANIPSVCRGGGGAFHSKKKMDYHPNFCLSGARLIRGEMQRGGGGVAPKEKHATRAEATLY